MRALAARLAAALLLAAPLAAAAQTAVPRPSRPIVLPAPVTVVPGYVAPPIEYHGAIAYNRATGAYGYSYDSPTPREAGIAAIDGCGDPKCTVAIAFKSGCAVLVDGPGGPVVTEGVNAREAEVKARARCTDPQCQVIAWACTR